jgi:putative transposase
MAMTATRHTTFSFTLEPTGAQEESLRRHVGAARFAFNQCLRLVQDELAKKKTDASVKVPWSGFDLINHWNAWKLTDAAGVDDSGKAGLPWRGEVCQQVFEEAAVDLGRALASFSDGRRGERRGRPPSFPKMKKKATARASFRLRNKGVGPRSAIRVGVGETARSIRLPKLGEMKVRECTRDLRRMVRRERAKILFATVSLRSDGRWRVSLNIEAKELHPAQRHASREAASVGIDRGLTTFAVIADEGGRDLARIHSPKPLRRALPVLRKKSKALSRKQFHSRNRSRARSALAKTHARISFVRRDFVHRQSSRLAKTHSRLVIEDLCTAGLMRTNLARPIADSAWALFATMLRYKTNWYGATLTVADRFYPSTRRCSACGRIGEKLELSERIFHCSSCGHEADRDTNAAANLACYLTVATSVHVPHVAAKHAETTNACGEGSAGARPHDARETALDETGRASARRPRRAVLAKSVNTL